MITKRKEIELDDLYKFANNCGHTFLDRVVGKGMSCKIIEELIQYKTIEEELGIDLVTLFKALKEGIYYKYKPYGYDYKISKCRECRLTGKKTLVVSYHTYKYLCDYGKTWALTREELK